MEECAGCLKIHSGRAAMRALRPGTESRSCPGDTRGGNERDEGARESAGKERSGWQGDGERSCYMKDNKSPTLHKG